jgi:CspA family cold shock protein
MKKGTIDRLVRERGFGFIRGERGESVFFHRSVLPAGEFDRLQVGDQVEFEEAAGDKGPKATRLSVVSRAGATP